MAPPWAASAPLAPLGPRAGPLEATTTPLDPSTTPGPRPSRPSPGRLYDLRAHPFAYERVVKLVLDEHGQRRRATTYLQPEDGFEPWAPQPGYFRVLWRAYARLGFDVAPLATAAGVEP